MYVYDTFMTNVSVYIKCMLLKYNFFVVVFVKLLTKPITGGEVYVLLHSSSVCLLQCFFFVFFFLKFSLNLAVLQLGIDFKIFEIISNACKHSLSSPRKQVEVCKHLFNSR